MKTNKITTFNNKPIPASAGIGLRAPHYIQVIESKPDIAWVEVHSENFFAQGGATLHILEEIRKEYPLSLHGIGLSLGTTDKLNQTHLKKLKHLVDRFNPSLVSEHISWSTVNSIYLNDLLPLPYTKDAITTLSSNIDQVQNYLGRQILIENPSTYLKFSKSEMSEYEFINQVIKTSGCGLLLDVNNIYVSGHNNNYDPYEYLKNISAKAVQEIHLAGHSTKQVQDQKILIDDHGSKVIKPVWDLYKTAIKQLGEIPTLIEWDTNIPELKVLENEAKKAQKIMNNEAN